MRIHLPTRLCADLNAMLQREYLVTNGLGGFAAASLAGALTRRYHGLLLAATDPPVGRTLLVAKLDETIHTIDEAAQASEARAAARQYPLYTNVWAGGVEQPTGVQHLRHFDLEWGVPSWTFEAGGAQLRKRIWMEHGRNVTYVQYELLSGGPITLACRLLVNERSYHYLVRGGDRAFHAHSEGAAIEIRTPGGAGPIRVRCGGPAGSRAEWQMNYTWCHDFKLPVEEARGFDHFESHLVAGLCTTPLNVGDVATFVVGAGADADVDERDALTRCLQRAQDLVSHAREKPGVAKSGGTNRSAPIAPPSLLRAQLALAADQFIVVRPAPDAPEGHTVIAGYPWFTDWGRDTMISLPGLTLVTGRHDVARQILRSWARYVREGLIPNRFPDTGGEVEYHTADATLWYLWAIDQYVRATHDVATLRELFPVMRDIVAAHRRGTRHNIHVQDDGLVYSGERGVNLTWMDAKIGDRVVTPRAGKSIELSALWYDALCNLARLADLVDAPGEEFAQLAARTERSFEKFWNPKRGCCFDVIEGPDGNDGAVRPNQIFAVSLTHSALKREQQEAVVATCEQKLLTWFGLRSLASDEPAYQPHYGGNPVQRDEAYHQGTVWGWLLGPFVLAHYRIHKDAAAARGFLEPMGGQLFGSGVGTLSEIFDASEPYRPDGCFAQAWSVAETLRAWSLTQKD